MLSEKLINHDFLWNTMLTPISFMENSHCKVYVESHIIEGICKPHSSTIEVDDVIINGEHVEAIELKRHTAKKLESVFLFKHLKMVTRGDKLVVYTPHYKFHDVEFIGCDGDNEGHVRYLFFNNNGYFLVIPISRVIAL